MFSFSFAILRDWFDGRNLRALTFKVSTVTFFYLSILISRLEVAKGKGAKQATKKQGGLLGYCISGCGSQNGRLSRTLPVTLQSSSLSFFETSAPASCGHSAGKTLWLVEMLMLTQVGSLFLRRFVKKCRIKHVLVW